MTRKIGAPLLLVILAVLLFFLSLQFGVIHLHTSALSLIGKGGSVDAATVWDVRFPRALGAVVIGAAMAIAGALAQGIFRNPLAEPTLIGLTSGATLGTIIGIATGFAGYGSGRNCLTATLGVAAAALITQVLAPNKNFGFLLTGIALASIFTSISGLIISISHQAGIQSLSFWNFGSLSLINFSTVRVITPFIAVGIAIAFFIARGMNLWSLGETNAYFLGINIRKFRLLAILAIALLIGPSVSAVGSIAFLGLLVPHVVRLILGPDHRNLILLSGILGSIVLLIADFLARAAFQPHEVPLGLLTSLLGAPVLIFLLRSRRSQWVSE
ncbi:MAG: iron ABC transporter permease [Actinomycetes bacterium]